MFLLFNKSTYLCDVGHPLEMDDTYGYRRVHYSRVCDVCRCARRRDVYGWDDEGVGCLCIFFVVFGIVLVAALCARLPDATHCGCVPNGSVLICT